MEKKPLLLALTTTLCPPKAARHAGLWALLGLLAALAFGPSSGQAAVTEAWVQRYNGPANLQDHATAVTVDGSGNVVVTGRSASGPGDGYPCCPVYDYYTAKYAAGNGSLLWEQRYNGPGNDDDWAKAVAVDGSGNVVVTGWSRGTNSNDYYTAKYAAGDGALFWERRYSGEPNSADAAWIVAVDGGDNVVVTWLSKGEYYTAKFAAASGEPLWEKHSTNSVQAVAVDGSGNVMVTGVSWNGTNSDYYTAKYAATDGELLWEKRSDGAPYNDDRALAVAADGSGNVVVTGYANTNYYTAKYAAANGALLWEKRYHGPANGYDSASSLALGPNGMVAVTGSSSYDYATVVYRDDVYPISIALVPTGIRLRFIGVPGRSYTIERAPAVTGPWTTLTTPTAPLGGLIEYVDTNAPAGTAFYRSVQP